MARMYRAFFDGTRASFLQDGLAAVYFGRDDDDADGLIYIHNIEINGRGGATTGTAVPPAVHLEGITSLSGGRDVAVKKFDTNSADLPAEVLVRVNATDHTSSRIIANNRRLHFIQSNETSGSVGGRGWLSFGGGKNTGDQFNNRKNNSALEGLVIREGEGFSICQVSQWRPNSHDIEIAFRDMSTGAQYIARTMQAYAPEGAGDEALFSIFNGSGSGAVYEVLRCTMCDVNGNTNTAARVRYGIIEGLRTFDEESLTRTRTIIPMDSSNALPSNTTAFVGPFVPIYLGESAGATVDWYNGESMGNSTNIRAHNMNMGTLRALLFPQRIIERVTATAPTGGRVWDGRSARQSPIVIRRGQGLAVMAGGQSVPVKASQDGGSCCFNIAIDFSYEPTPAAYPTPDEVRDATWSKVLPGSDSTPTTPPSADNYADAIWAKVLP